MHAAIAMVTLYEPSPLQVRAYVRLEDGPHVRPGMMVRVEAAAGEFADIVSGLTPADKLIAAGRDGLRDGDRIRVTGEELAPAAPMTGGPAKAPASPHQGGH